MYLHLLTRRLLSSVFLSAFVLLLLLGTGSSLYGQFSLSTCRDIKQKEASLGITLFRNLTSIDDCVLFIIDTNSLYKQLQLGSPADLPFVKARPENVEISAARRFTRKDLDMHYQEMRAPNFQVLRHSPTGTIPVPFSTLVEARYTYEGKVKDKPESQVALYATPQFVSGFILVPDEGWVFIEPLMPLLRANNPDRTDAQLLNLANALGEPISPFTHIVYNAADTNFRIRLDTIVRDPQDPRPALKVCASARTSELAKALDANENGHLDDDEILQALQTWISDALIPGTNLGIDDEAMVGLLGFWVGEGLICEGLTITAVGDTKFLALDETIDRGVGGATMRTWWQRQGEVLLLASTIFSSINLPLKEKALEIWESSGPQSESADILLCQLMSSSYTEAGFVHLFTGQDLQPISRGSDSGRIGGRGQLEIIGLTAGIGGYGTPKQVSSNCLDPTAPASNHSLSQQVPDRSMLELSENVNHYEATLMQRVLLLTHELAHTMNAQHVNSTLLSDLCVFENSVCGESLMTPAISNRQIPRFDVDSRARLLDCFGKILMGESCIPHPQ
ncbi:hypothetical protein HY230_07860 [Candidatus Acetothermia bacterium]|nr:hypothetical protein [Candidatus Acetothermia bacterium]